MSAPLCRPLVRALGAEGKWLEVVVLALFGGLWGLVYGLIINIWFWPFAVGPSSQHWEPGVAWIETIKRYLVFYLATSLAWDALRMAGNMLFILVFGMPVIRTLRRFHKRFAFSYRPELSSPAQEARI